MRHDIRAAAALGVALTLLATSAFAALSKSDIERGVMAKSDRLSACYEAAVDRNPELPTGTLVMRYTVATDGQVSQAQVLQNHLGDAEPGRCMRGVFLTLDYGPIDEQTVVKYPLELAP